LCLRAFEPRDVKTFVEAARESHASVGRWLPWCRADYSEPEAKAWFRRCRADIRSGSAYELGVFEPDGTVLLGGASLNQIDTDRRRCNLGYWVRESRHGMGIAPRAGLLLARFGFANLPLEAIEIVVAEGNAASRRVAEKLRARFDGIVPNRIVLGGVAVPAAIYTLAPQALPESRADGIGSQQPEMRRRGPKLGRTSAVSTRPG
jgi:RimJ/RimL family protein N-acetyltransferase